MSLNIMHECRLLYSMRRLSVVKANLVSLQSRLCCDDTQARRKPQGGGRVLQDWKHVFKYNAWDNVVWDDAQEAEARALVEKNSEVKLTLEEIEKLEENAALNWDGFYEIHQNRFFKDRNWLFTEFPELAHSFVSQEASASGSTSNSLNFEDLDFNKTNISESVDVDKVNSERTKSSDVETSDKSEVCTTVSSETTKSDTYPGQEAKFRILEVGCGVGNTVFPILRTNNSQNIFVYACDFSNIAVDLVKSSPEYDEKRCHAFVCDIASENWNTPFPEGSLNVIVCIFVLSAIHPDKLQQVIKNMVKYLCPGGLILFRDYGRYDLAQVRYKPGRCLSENFYARGDGTRCYYFTQEDVRSLMTSEGLEEVQNLVDRRLQVNRGKRQTMYRVWVQAKYRKPLSEDISS